MGIAATQPGELDVIGNTLDLPSSSATALWENYPHNTRIWFNVVNGRSAIGGNSPTTRVLADVRFNPLGAIYDWGAPSQSLNDWSDNWWGANANLPLPSYMDPTPQPATRLRPAFQPATRRTPVARRSPRRTRSATSSTRVAS